MILLAASTLSWAANLTNDFSITNGNPNGAWSYGYKSTVTGSFTAFDTAMNLTFRTANFDSWFSSTVDTINISKLISGTLNGVNGGVGGVAIGDVSMHGSADGRLATARYTVGTSGLFDLSGFFKSGDGTNSFGKIDGYLYHNSTQLYSVLNTGVTQNFSLSSVSLTAGDTLDLMVGIGNDTYLYDTTPVNLSITPVPEPATMAVLGLGVAALLRRRKAA